MFVLEWACGADSACNILQAVPDLLNFESDGPERAPPPGSANTGRSSRGQCYLDEAEVPLPYQVPQLKPRLGQVASLPAGALSGPLSACVSARRLAVGRRIAD